MEGEGAVQCTYIMSYILVTHIARGCQQNLPNTTREAKARVSRGQVSLTSISFAMRLRILNKCKCHVMCYILFDLFPFASNSFHLIVLSFIKPFTLYRYRNIWDSILFFCQICYQMLQFHLGNVIEKMERFTYNLPQKKTLAKNFTCVRPI
jgi:hypothetical protein